MHRLTALLLTTALLPFPFTLTPSRAWGGALLPIQPSSLASLQRQQHTLRLSKVEGRRQKAENFNYPRSKPLAWNASLAALPPMSPMMVTRQSLKGQFPGSAWEPGSNHPLHPLQNPLPTSKLSYNFR